MRVALVSRVRPCSFCYVQNQAAADAHTLSLHDALPILAAMEDDVEPGDRATRSLQTPRDEPGHSEQGGIGPDRIEQDRKSTRLNSSHVANSYAVTRLKKNRNKRSIGNSVLN